MGQVNIPRVVIAGTSSGVGKTTIVTGLLAALKKCGLQVQSYKVGPDYIDPGYHSLASGKAAHNLDTWLVPPEKVVPIFAKTAKDNDLAVIEGVMGLYDGGRTGVSSTAAIARMLNAPVILVVDAKSMGESVAATVLGYKMYDPQVRLAGVIVNRLGSATHKAMVCEALERLGVPVVGCMYRNDALSMPERHLGLTPVTEHDAYDTVGEMGRQIAEQVDVTGIIEIARSAATLVVPEEDVVRRKTEVRVGVAQDEGFSFYYPESLSALEAAGAELVPFSPLKDKHIPAVDGLVLGGGFPEMFVEELAANESMRQSINQACRQGLPVYAECGGLMYLTRQIVDFAGKAYDMAGVIPAICSMESRLQTVGYVEATALNDNVLCQAGETLRGHEFHFSRMIPDGEPDRFPWAFQFKKMRTGSVYPGGYASGNIVGSYLHMHFAGNEQAAERFVEKCKLKKLNIV